MFLPKSLLDKILLIQSSTHVLDTCYITKQIINDDTLVVYDYQEIFIGG